MRRPRSAPTVLAALAIGAAACSTATSAAVGGPAASPSPTAPAASATVEVTAVDYGFEGVPSTVAAGTRLTLVNASRAEFHEMVVMRINDGEERPIGELLALPEEQQQEVGTFVGAGFAMPEEPAAFPMGDIVLAEPGRYALLCFIPVGADPAAVQAAMEQPSTDGPPALGDGAPHFTEGMVAELTVD